MVELGVTQLVGMAELVEMAATQMLGMAELEGTKEKMVLVPPLVREEMHLEGMVVMVVTQVVVEPLMVVTEALVEQEAPVQAELALMVARPTVVMVVITYLI